MAHHTFECGKRRHDTYTASSGTRSSETAILVNILGIWDGHDSGAAVLVDGRVVAAVNEERFTRRKLEVRFPLSAIGACLQFACLEGADIDLVAASTTDVAKTLARWFPSTKERYYALRRRQTEPGPLASFQRHLKYRLTELGSGRSSRYLSQVALRHTLRETGIDGTDVVLFDHHECHAIAAAQTCGQPCVVLTVDGLGDGLSSTVSVCHGGKLERGYGQPGQRIPRGLLRARDAAPQYARAGGRREGHGLGRLRLARP